MILPLWSCGEKYDGNRVNYDSTNYSFTIDDGLELDYEPYEDENGNVNSYEFKGKLFEELTVQGGYIHQLTAIATEKDNAESLKKDDDVQDVSWEEIKDASYPCAALHYKDPSYDEDEGQWVSEYLMTYQSRSFTVSARYKDKNKKAARAEMERIVKSASYTSDFMLPTNEQDYTCQLFNFHYGPQWMIERDRGEDLANSVMGDIKCCYAETDDPDAAVGECLPVAGFCQPGPGCLCSLILKIKGNQPPWIHLCQAQRVVSAAAGRVDDDGILADVG